MSNKESLEYIRHAVSERLCVVELEISKWDERDRCDCIKCPDSPRCLYVTERDILKRYMDCLERQLYNVKAEEQ